MTEKATCGIDEAGRGCLAGPVFAAAVVLPCEFPIQILADSKALSAKKREEAEKVIRELCLFGIGEASSEEIDRLNILQASLLAMKRAHQNLLANFPDVQIGTVIVDGNKTPDIQGAIAQVKADAKVFSVMAASILAKTARDRRMKELSALYPEYQYDIHKGYPTPAHKKICRTLGPSPIQRLTFRY